MKIKKSKWIIILILSVLLFATLVLVNYPPKSYRESKGPSTEFLATKGVFKPGGYIEFVFSPELESLKGYNKGLVNVHPLYPDKIDLDNPVWNETGFIAFGRDWGGSISGNEKSMKNFTIKHRINIPRDDSLAGQEILMLARYSIHYPVYVGVASGVNRYTFKEESKNMDEYITILLKDEKFTPEEERYKERVDGPLGTFSALLVIVAIILGFYALMRIIIPGKN